MIFRNVLQFGLDLTKAYRMRCDRALPVCGSCIRRGDVAGCSYQSDRSGIRKSWTRVSAPMNCSSDDVQSRLSRLEYMISTLTEKGLSSDSVNTGNDAKSQSESLLSFDNEQSSPMERTFDGNLANEMAFDSPSQSPTRKAAQGDLRTTKPSTIRRDARYSRSFPVAIPHWEALLNEVGLRFRDVTGAK